MTTTYVASFPAFATVQQHPIKDAILGISVILQHLHEQIPQELVIRLFLEPKLANIVHVDRKLLCGACVNLPQRDNNGSHTRKAFAQFRDWRALLLLTDLFVFLLVGGCFEALPW